MSAVLKALTECAGPVIVLAAIYLLGKASEARRRRIARTVRTVRRHPSGGPR